MPTAPCPIAIGCADPNIPITNLSAEAPDPLLFGAIAFPFGDPSNPLPTDPTNTDPTTTGPVLNAGCLGVCYATGADAAQLCAQAQAAECQQPQKPQKFFNESTQCCWSCPDGTPFCWTVAAGTFVSGNQATANDLANTYACQQAANKWFCLSNIDGGCLNVPYAQIINVSGHGLAPFTFSIDSGSLPNGLTFETLSPTSASIFGTPTTTGTFVFTVKAVDANGNFVAKQYSLVVIGLTNSPDTACDAAYYSFTLGAAGGTAPYTFSVASGALPTGLTLASDGTLSGTPAQAGTFPFEVLITDANGKTCQPTVTMDVLGINNLPTLPSGTENAAYSVQLQGAGGTAPYTYSIVTGALPSGLTLSSSGLISGTVAYKTASNTPYDFTVRITDANSLTCVIPGTMSVALAPGPNWLNLSWPTYQANQSLPGNTASGSGSGNTWNGQLVKDGGTFFPRLDPVSSSALPYSGPAVTARVELTISNVTGTAGSIVFSGVSEDGGVVGAIYDILGAANGVYTFDVSIASGSHTWTIKDAPGGTDWAILTAYGSAGTINFSAIIYNL